MTKSSKSFYEDIRRFLAYSTQLYIKEQAIHIHDMRDIFASCAIQQLKTELDKLRDTYDELFGDIHEANQKFYSDCDLMIKYSKHDWDPDIFFFDQLNRSCKMFLNFLADNPDEKALVHDLICLRDHTHAVLDDDNTLTPDPYQTSWKKNLREDGYSASTMYRTLLPELTTKDKELYDQYAGLQFKLDKIRRDMYIESMTRLMTQYHPDKSYNRIRDFVEQIDSMWV